MTKNDINIQLGSRTVNSESRPYVIAEIGVNHEGSLDLAKKLIDLAKEGGADAAKFQSYKADTIASKDSPAYWDTSQESTQSQHKLFKKYDQFEPDDYLNLAEYCKKTKIDFLSTPFDDNAIEFLDPLMSFYKIASADITNTPFIRKIGCKGKPVILSTGASTVDEISIAVQELENAGCQKIGLLHCILNYPTPYENAHLKMITGLKETFPNHVIGYSDHTLPDSAMTSLITAYLLGAVIIEKHFTHDKSLTGNDHYHAMDVNDLKRFIELINQIHISLGSGRYKKPIKTEEISRMNARRSIVMARDVQKGHILTVKDLTYKRPGTGVSTIFWDQVIGKKAKTSLKADQILSWSDLQ